MNSNQKKQSDEGQRGSPYWGLWSEDSSLRSSNQEVLTKKFFGQVDCMRTRWRYQFVFIELVLDTIQWMPSIEYHSIAKRVLWRDSKQLFFDANLNMMRVIKEIVDRLDAIRSNWCFSITDASWFNCGTPAT